MKSDVKAVGTRVEVFHGLAKHTSGGLKKADLTKNKAGRIVSKKKAALGKKLATKFYKKNKEHFEAILAQGRAIRTAKIMHARHSKL